MKGKGGCTVEPIDVKGAQAAINSFANKDVYIHLETTNGAYASHNDQSFFSAGAFIRNALVRYELGKITGNGSFRVGLKINLGWIYAEGIPQKEIDEDNYLLVAWHDHEGKLTV